MFTQACSIVVPFGGNAAPMVFTSIADALSWTRINISIRANSVEAAEINRCTLDFEIHELEVQLHALNVKLLHLEDERDSLVTDMHTDEEDISYLLRVETELENL